MAFVGVFVWERVCLLCNDEVSRVVEIYVCYLRFNVIGRVETFGVNVGVLLSVCEIVKGSWGDYEK